MTNELINANDIIKWSSDVIAVQRTNKPDHPFLFKPDQMTNEGYDLC